MARLQLSSGDLIADRRADYARMLAEAGDHRAAADLMRQALDLAPEWAAGWFSLGTHAEKAGDRDGAIEAYREVRRLTDEDIFGAALKLALLGEAAVPAAPPSPYVAALFDDYADRFEAALVERLDYRVPDLLDRMIARSAGALHRFARAIDLGCGTGLMGERLRPRCSVLEGYDISAGMLAKAGEKAIYDRLGLADLSRPLGETQAIAAFPPADLVAAADVVMYLGALDTFFETAAALLGAGGVLAFSTERGAPDGPDWQLRESLRYAHREDYVLACASDRGFRAESVETATIRRDGTEAITGTLFLFRR